MTRDEFYGCTAAMRDKLGVRTTQAVQAGLLGALMAHGISMDAAEETLRKYRDNALAGRDIFTGEPCAASTA